MIKPNIGWLLVFATFIWAIALPLFMDGMFTDGLLYSAVSRNLALGLGSFWNPHFSNTLYPNFHEQPPLAIWLQSLFFKIDSSSIYPERIYCFVFAIFTITGIMKFWNLFFPKANYWPVLKPLQGNI